MDGALKKKGISLSMQYLNETPLAQIASSRGESDNERIQKNPMDKPADADSYHTSISPNLDTKDQGWKNI